MIVASFGSRSRTAVATFASTGSAIITAASQSLTRKAISAGVIRKFTGTAMAPSLIGRKEGLDELGPVQHQDQHPVAERDAATAQRTRER